MKTGAINHLWTLTRGQRRRFFPAIAALLLATAVGMIAPLVPAVVIDALMLVNQTDEAAQTAAANPWLDRVGGARQVIDQVWLYAVVLVLLVIIAGGLSYLKDRWAAGAAEAIARNLRDRLYDHLQRLPTEFFHQAETGDTVQRCTSDVETVRLFYASQMVELGRSVLMLILIVPFMLMISPMMTVIALALMPVLVVFAVIFFLSVKRVFKASDEAEGRLTATLQENLTNIRVVRAFGRAAFETERFSLPNRDYRDRTLKVYHVMAGYWSLSELICTLQIGLVLIGGAWMVSQGDLTVGRLFAFLAYVQMMLWPVRQMGRVLSDMGKAMVAVGRIREILDRDEESEPIPEQRLSLPEPVQGSLTIEGLRFAYGSTTVLDDLKLHIPAGSTVGILGPSGSGKSTLISLLLRLEDPAEGAIVLDGVDIGRVPRPEVRRQIGVVLQEPFLYSRSVRENIQIGLADREVDEPMLLRAAQDAAVHETIAGFGEGYETVVGERGVRLSGGQRQRIVLARALIKDPPILILDDAMSAVDTRTEQAILTALRHRRGRRTTLLIAHRLSTLAHADFIVVMEHGRITHQGTHEQLLAEPGLYQRLWRIQNDPGGDDDTDHRESAEIEASGFTETDREQEAGNG